MANHVIKIHTDGTVDQPSVKVSGKSNDTVTWQADKDTNGNYPQWYIYFQTDPFSDHLIATDTNGKTPKLTVYSSLSLGTCPYSIVSTNPTLLKKRNLHILQDGGGIIIDS
jgi:hypothetical protein